MNIIDEAGDLSILIVDDTPANLDLLAGMLKERGYKIQMATSGELGLRAAKSDSPDLILLDILMPGMNGYEMCARLKADQSLKEIPVIFLSALNETDAKVKAFGAGGADFIEKPFHFAEVNARVETQLKITAQKHKLRESYNKLSELEKMRDSLVHMMVHDLRSPLTAIYGLLDLLNENENGRRPAQEMRNIGHALASAKQMVHMVNDMLDTSKMEGGEMKLNLKDCDLSAVGGEVLEKMKLLAGTRRLSFESGKLPVRALADKELVARVLQNLLGNALKFAPKEGGSVRLEIKKVGAGARLSVENNGPAIPPEYQQKIFEKFGQIETGAGKSGYSTGLGLHFCKLVAEAHGGTIGVISEPGQPVNFWFELPGKSGPAV